MDPIAYSPKFRNSQKHHITLSQCEAARQILVFNLQSQMTAMTMGYTTHALVLVCVYLTNIEPWAQIPLPSTSREEGIMCVRGV